MNVQLSVTILTVLLLFGCAQLPSGEYIQLRQGDSLKSLSKELKVPAWRLKAVNPGRRFKAQEWIFVPRSQGILGQQGGKGRSLSSFGGSDQLVWPVPSSSRISSKFGKRWGKSHEGVDIAARRGAKIVAVEQGVVVYSGSGLSGYGNLTVISHHDGLFSVYAHARKNFTRKGDHVARGEVIAEVGMTGRTTGPHLHFELRYDGQALNPLNHLAKR